MNISNAHITRCSRLYKKQSSSGENGICQQIYVGLEILAIATAMFPVPAISRNRTGDIRQDEAVITHITRWSMTWTLPCRAAEVWRLVRFRKTVKAAVCAGEPPLYTSEATPINVAAPPLDVPSENDAALYRQASSPHTRKITTFLSKHMPSFLTR